MDGNQEVIGVLKNVAEQVKILREVAKTEVNEALNKNMAACDATLLSRDRDCKRTRTFTKSHRIDIHYTLTLDSSNIVV